MAEIMTKNKKAASLTVTMEALLMPVEPSMTVSNALRKINSVNSSVLAIMMTLCPRMSSFGSII